MLCNIFGLSKAEGRSIRVAPRKHMPRRTAGILEAYMGSSHALRAKFTRDLANERLARLI